MKTKDLIKKLQELDPSGETEVFFDDKDSLFIRVEPMHSGSWAQRLDKNGYDEVRGATLVGEGNKISVRTISMNELIKRNPNIKISIEGDDEYGVQEDAIEQMRNNDLGQKSNKTTYMDKLSKDIFKPKKKFSVDWMTADTMKKCPVPSYSEAHENEEF